MLFERQQRATPRQLRQFAGALIVFTLIFVLRVWWRQGTLGQVALALSGAALLCGVIGLIRPRRIQWLFKALMTLSWPLGVIVSEVMIAILYFLVVTPVALALRVLRQDRLSRAIDRQAPTYWIAHKRAEDQSRYFRQS